jgi:hypothetical protein
MSTTDESLSNVVIRNCQFDFEFDISSTKCNWQTKDKIVQLKNIKYYFHCKAAARNAQNAAKVGQSDCIFVL